jgi:hypothetical protein
MVLQATLTCNQQWLILSRMYSVGLFCCLFLWEILLNQFSIFFSGIGRPNWCTFLPPIFKTCPQWGLMLEWTWQVCELNCSQDFCLQEYAFCHVFFLRLPQLPQIRRLTRGYYDGKQICQHCGIPVCIILKKTWQASHNVAQIWFDLFRLHRSLYMI